jgi:hypothetical protein
MRGYGFANRDLEGGAFEGFVGMVGLDDIIENGLLATRTRGARA